MQGPVRNCDLWALLVLTAVVGAYLGVGIYMLVQKVLHG